MADYKRVMQGYRSRTEGAMFEKMIEHTLDYYRERKLAFVEKTPEPMKPIRRLERGQFVSVFTKCAQPDFKGTLKNGGSVCFEAKFTEDMKIQQNVVSPEQSESLRLHQELGAGCYVVVCFNFEKYFAVPFKAWDKMKELYGRKYATPGDLENFEVVKNKDGVLDFLNLT